MKYFCIKTGYLLVISFISVYSQFENFENFDLIDKPKIISKRSIGSSQKLHINTKFKNFNLILNPSEALFAKNFKAYSVDKTGKRNEVIIDSEQYFDGYISGEPQSSIRAHITDEEISINILDKDEMYEIEPVSRYTKKYSDKSIVYRLKDIKRNKTKSSCGTRNANSSSGIHKENERVKRQMEIGPISSLSSESNNNDQKKLCTLKLVADYRFHKRFGYGNTSKTHHYLIEIIDNINQLFQKSEFVDMDTKKYTNYGFIIKEIEVHTEPTIGHEVHYNEYRKGDTDVWNHEDLLNKFSYADFREFCLAHLFTYQSFTEGTLGIAYMATWKGLSGGGMCSTRELRTDKFGFKSVNSAFSTYRDSGGNPVVSLVAALVTAHELGHNMGADHDPDTPACNPSSDKGGKYIMYMYSVVGYEKNNRAFSPCSLSNIGETLRVRGPQCLKSNSEVQTFYCGNRRVDNNEECDVGRSNSDPCCTDRCKLKPGATCSPANHECCTKTCQLKPHGVLCALADPLNPCLGNATCSGISKLCSPPKPLSGANCMEHGKCLDGRCQPFCETLNLTPCICDNVTQSCQICCHGNKTSTNNTSGNCRPASYFMTESQRNSMKELVLNDGRPCLQGLCKSGRCMRKVNKLIERIWKIIDNFDTNLFAGILLDNLVGAVIVLSLLLWIPAACVVRYYDKNQNNRGQLTFQSVRRQK